MQNYATEINHVTRLLDKIRGVAVAEPESKEQWYKRWCKDELAKAKRDGINVVEYAKALQNLPSRLHGWLKPKNFTGYSNYYRLYSNYTELYDNNTGFTFKRDGTVSWNPVASSTWATSSTSVPFAVLRSSYLKTNHYSVNLDNLNPYLMVNPIVPADRDFFWFDESTNYQGVSNWAISTPAQTYEADYTHEVVEFETDVTVTSDAPTQSANEVVQPSALTYQAIAAIQAGSPIGVDRNGNIIYTYPTSAEMISIAGMLRGEIIITHDGYKVFPLPNYKDPTDIEIDDIVEPVQAGEFDIEV